MMKLFVFITLLASLLYAGKADLSTPESTVKAYYDAYNNADTDTLSEVMVQSSFDEDMQVYALSVAFQKPAFQKTLDAYETSETARKEVIAAVREKLKTRKKRAVSDFEVMNIGDDRRIVRFIEDGKKERQLYVRKIGDIWRIDYLAGRPVK